MTSDPTIEAFGESLQYRERYQEGYNSQGCHGESHRAYVAIPRAVSGGLQFIDAAKTGKIVVMLQYRERYQEGYNS